MESSHNEILSEVVAFDFDGTITSCDSLLLLLSHAFGRTRLYVYLLFISPLLVLMKLRLYSNHTVKQRLFAHFFRGMTTNDFEQLCHSFAHNNRHILRPQAIETLENTRQRGARVAVISASIDDWVAPFFPSDVVIIGTKVEKVDGRLTGRFLTHNCYGPEKVRRLLEIFPERHTYRLTAYGDSRGDKQLLALADEAHYRAF